jgi:hypothetical protein
MKFFFLIFSSMVIGQQGICQLKTTPLCPPITADLLTGYVNKLDPTSSWEEIKTSFPCYSEAVEKGTDTKCAGVFYKDKDIYFYTERNYIEIGEHFKGVLSLPLMGAARSSLFKSLGYPKIKDISWDAYQMQYGILIVYYDKQDKVNKLQMSNKSTETIRLCE